MEFGKIIFGIIGVCLLSGYSDAAISGWTKPTIATKSGSGTSTGNIAENTAENTATITVTATTGGGTISSYTPTPAVQGGRTFTIAQTGVVTFVSGTLDFETTPTIELIVVATDSTSDVATATVTVSLTNVNEAPIFELTLAGVVATSGSAAGTAIYSAFSATDPESHTVVGYTIASGNTNTDFAISSTTGAITVATGKTLNSATTATYALVIEANDGQSTALTGTTTLAVIVGSVCSGVAALTVTMMTVLVASLVVFLK